MELRWEKRTKEENKMVKKLPYVNKPRPIRKPYAPRKVYKHPKCQSFVDYNARGGLEELTD